MARRMLVVWLGLLLSAGCGEASSDGDASSGADASSGESGGSDAADAVSGDVAGPCDDCPPGTFCVDDACSDQDPADHWDCGGAVRCEFGQIWAEPTSGDPDAEDPCAATVVTTCEYGCVQGDKDPDDPDSWCSPEPCSPAAQDLSGTPVTFEELNLPCWDASVSPDDPPPEEVTIATSAEEVLMGMECQQGGDQIDVDFAVSRVAIIRGSTTDEPRPVAWVPPA